MTMKRYPAVMWADARAEGAGVRPAVEVRRRGRKERRRAAVLVVDRFLRETEAERPFYRDAEEAAALIGDASEILSEAVDLGDGPAALRMAGRVVVLSLRFMAECGDLFLEE